MNPVTTVMALLSLLIAAVSASAQTSPYQPYQAYLPQGVAFQTTTALFQSKMPKAIAIPQTAARSTEQDFIDPVMRAKPIETVVYKFFDGKLVAGNFEGELPNGTTAAAALAQLRSVVLSGFTKVRDDTLQILNDWRKESAAVEVFEKAGTQESAYLVSVGNAVRVIVFDRSKARQSDFFPDVSTVTEQDLQKFRGGQSQRNP